jgi:hypothetical protein
MDFSIVGILIVHRCQLQTWNLNQLTLISKKWPNYPCFSCEAFVKAQSFNDFGGILKHISYIKLNRSLKIGQLYHYVELVDMVDFDFYIYIYV